MLTWQRGCTPCLSSPARAGRLQRTAPPRCSKKASAGGAGRGQGRAVWGGEQRGGSVVVASRDRRHTSAAPWCCLAGWLAGWCLPVGGGELVGGAGGDGVGHTRLCRGRKAAGEQQQRRIQGAVLGKAGTQAGRQAGTQAGRQAICHDTTSQPPYCTTVTGTSSTTAPTTSSSSSSETTPVPLPWWTSKSRMATRRTPAWRYTFIA